MESNRTRRLIGTLLIILSTTSVSNGFQHQQQNTTFSNRLRRAVETPGVGSLPPQPDICREFVESKVILKGSKATSPADIFNDLPIGKDFATAGRKYAKDYIFQSPNYPHNYPNSMQCIKLIVAPSDEHRIYLQILHPFALEPDSLCAMDFLEVRDGAYGFSPLIGRFCSRLLPPEGKDISSSGQFLWLRFRSDGTLPHAGFRAIYHFEKLNDGTQDNQDYQPKILRKQSLFKLKEDEQWTLRHEFLIKQLETITPEENQLPLEAVFDIRSPPETHILMHVHHFQVPQIAAWSCNPDYLARQKAIKYCDYHSGSLAVYPDTFTEKPPNLLQVKSYTPSVPDPSSHIDGKHTFIEIYADGNTVTDSSPPCPCVERFCIASAATDLIDSSTSASSSNKGTEDGHQQRQFLVLAPRLVVRLVVAKPSKMEASQPEMSSNEQFTPTDVENTDGWDENEKSLNIFSMLPNFTITVTALSPRINGACAPSQRSCDENYCIQNAHWCDGIINCPLGQDEGEAACNPEKAGAIENPEETGTTSMSEKDKAALEKAMEERADLEKHAAIIGCISLTMLIFTVICMFFAIRRKRKEASHHEIEIKLPSELSSLAQINENDKISPPSMHPSNLQHKDMVADFEQVVDDVDDEPPFSNSGDPLLGGDLNSHPKGSVGPQPPSLIPNHWYEKRPVVSPNTVYHIPKIKSPSTKTTNQSRQRIPQNQPKNLGSVWQSDANLIHESQNLQYKGKLGGGDSAKSLDESTSFQYHQHQPQPRLNQQPKTQQTVHAKGFRQQQHHYQQQPSILRQKTDSTDTADSSQRTRMLKCRMITENPRTRSLVASRFRLYDSHDFIENGSSSSSGSSNSPASCLSSSSSCTSSTTCAHRNTRDNGGYENLVTYGLRINAFRSMPDMNRALRTTGFSGSPYQPNMSCGHKDCRDYYRLQALRSEINKNQARRRLMAEKPALFRDREIELTPSSEGEQNEGSGIDKNSAEIQIKVPNPLAYDAYSVHGLSDAISVASSKEGGSVSEDSQSTLSESPRRGAYLPSIGPVPPRPPSRISNNTSLHRIPSVSKRLGSPEVSRSKLRAPTSSSNHPVAPNLLVYEYEA